MTDQAEHAAFNTWLAEAPTEATYHDRDGTGMEGERSGSTQAGAREGKATAEATAPPEATQEAVRPRQVPSCPVARLGIQAHGNLLSAGQEGQLPAPDAPPTLPAEDMVTMEQRDSIAFSMAASGRTMREIGAALGIAHTTASRGIKREAARRAESAQDGARDALDREVLRANLYAALRAAWAVTRDESAKPRTVVAAARAVGVLVTRAARLLGLGGAIVVRHETADVEILSYDPRSGRITVSKPTGDPQ